MQDNHFYSFGLDYKKDNAFNSRFVSTVLQEGYLYNFELNREQTVENILENKSNTPTNPCKNPDVFVRIESSGYCADNDRPAIIVECENCSKSDWKFSVELRTEYSTWETLRADGQAQHARGNARRTEPLCLLDPGAYYVRVLAWGLYCEAPIVYNVSNPIVISEVELKTGVAYNSENENIEVEPAPPLPDSCVVNGWGLLYGSFLQ